MFDLVVCVATRARKESACSEKNVIVCEEERMVGP